MMLIIGVTYLCNICGMRDGHMYGLTIYGNTYAVQMANFIKNWTVFLKGEDKSPYKALYGEEWDLSRF